MISYQIVGAFYRPPAQLIINALPQGTTLHLRPEPQNPYDSNAIQVLIKTENISSNCHDALTEELAKKGLELDQILAQDEWHLGYIKKEIATELRRNNIISNSEELVGTFKIDFGGKANVELEE